MFGLRFDAPVMKSAVYIDLEGGGVQEFNLVQRYL